ncbi:Na+/H+ antiporter subunit C [Pseudidiomarina terrestris]|uniref:Na+/H+ antiporter subunit C n=1 Tax=Pseudidiomarina terrestris TaxID=2820060 RepID=A0AAW7R4N5_9GAMM|nr:MULTISPECIES: Na+/H+ antiporter subunit C [unclassified Pseudidiomarina]MDN7125716.1 Na+/H+ antiporter subunit C [Pseudidiomarina sp. 1APP75-32.1]MDN7128160.1 Na+/H+ antiporter subunit C [Pseudidiomarina sp. 1APR75-33.1]MDN7130642.1 Na+/H+ antiporter subunit C [Pseudidiomarina sp. 1APR75-15]MDN7136557.1 Na+/H+ antiporter subunit C [Pseudidiomarina sp. 1ASP75-5]MDN7138929.1 Na+/H+ antiporter subunit C [Pseudidiomarina sp. 1ASP75-14]
METLYAITVGTLTACSVFLILRGRSFPIVIGITMLSYAVNLFLFSTGRLTVNELPLVGLSESSSDPLPQALVLTAIVIGFAMTAYSIILAVRVRGEIGSDEVNDSNYAEQEGQR